MEHKTMEKLVSDLISEHTDAEVKYIRFSTVSYDENDEATVKYVEKEQSKILDMILSLRTTMGELGIPYAIVVHADGEFDINAETLSVNGVGNVAKTMYLDKFFGEKNGARYAVTTADDTEHTGYVQLFADRQPPTLYVSEDRFADARTAVEVSSIIMISRLDG